MKQPIDLRPDHAKIVHEIIARHLPAGVSVRVFGSRAKWTAKPHSDLDLALKGKEALPLSVLGDLAEAFSESDLPFRVDVVDWHTVAPSFQAVIDRDGLPLPWPLFPLKQFIDAGRSICYGIVQPGKPVANGVPIVRVNNFGANGLDTSDALRIAPDIEAQYTRSRLQGGELLITLVGSVGQSAIVPPELRGWNVARAVGVVPISDELTTRWIKFVLARNKAQEFFSQRANTTVQTTVNLRDLAELPIPTPPREGMQDLVSVLAALDDKIDLNRRMNETLERQAQAIFRDWFVDFGPVRRKAAGETDAVAIMGGLTPDPARAAQLAALFPNAFGDDGLPVGWGAQSIYNFSSVVYGAPFASKRFNADGIGRPLVRIRDLQKHGSALFTDEVHSREYVIQPGDIVVGMDGEFRARVWQGVPSLMNQRVCCFKPNSSDKRAFVYLSIKPILDRMEKSAVGTTVIHLGKGDIDRFVAIDPGEELIAAFGDMVEAMLDRLTANGLENRTLAETRDYLLPRLMSGTVRVARESEAA